MPIPETILWTELKGRRLQGHKFRRQYSVRNFVLDFYCHGARLAIEVDGESYYTKGKMSEDMERQSLIESYGINFVRFTNKEITQNLAGVLAKIIEGVVELTSSCHPPSSRENPSRPPLAKGRGEGGYTP